MTKILAVSQEQTSQISSFLRASEFCVRPPDGYRASTEAKGLCDGLQLGNA